MLLIFQKKRIHFIKKVEEKDLSKEKDFDFFENLQRKEMKRKGFRPTRKSCFNFARLQANCGPYLMDLVDNWLNFLLLNFCYN